MLFFPVSPIAAYGGIKWMALYNFVSNGPTALFCCSLLLSPDFPLLLVGEMTTVHIGETLNWWWHIVKLITEHAILKMPVKWTKYLCCKGIYPFYIHGGRSELRAIFIIFCEICHGFMLESNP